MGYVMFRGVSTDSLTNVYVSKMPSHKKAGMRYSEYYVKGRDGALHVDEGYQNYQIQVTLVLLDAGVESRYQVNAWADGTGKLISSDDLTKAYIASVKNEVTWQRVKAASFAPEFSETKSYVVGDIVRYDGSVYRFNTNHTGAWDASDVNAVNSVVNGLYDTATILFNCQPFMVEAVDSSVTLTETGTLVNPGSGISYPMIQVSGSGDASFSVNGNEIQIDDMTSGVVVNIDCENGYVYTASGATSIRGEIPVLELGTNTITFGSNVTSITILPHWRWI